MVVSLLVISAFTRLSKTLSDTVQEPLLTVTLYQLALDGLIVADVAPVFHT